MDRDTRRDKAAPVEPRRPPGTLASLKGAMVLRHRRERAELAARHRIEKRAIDRRMVRSWR